MSVCPCLRLFSGPKSWPPSKTAGEMARVPSISGKAERLLKLLKTLWLCWAIKKALGPCFLCVFFWSGTGLVCTTYILLGIIMHSGLLSEQYLPWWDREQFDSKWFLEKYGKLYGHQRKTAWKQMPQMLETNVWGCCCSILFLYVHSFSFFRPYIFRGQSSPKSNEGDFTKKTGSTVNP